MSDLQFKIIDALLKLDDNVLSNYEHTTHARMGPNTIEGVADALVKAFNQPGAFAISDLSQAIRGLAKEQA